MQSFFDNEFPRFRGQREIREVPQFPWFTKILITSQNFNISMKKPFKMHYT